MSDGLIEVRIHVKIHRWFRRSRHLVFDADVPIRPGEDVSIDLRLVADSAWSFDGPKPHEIEATR